MAKRPNQVNFVTTDDFDQKVEAIRASRRPIPNVSELMRALVAEEYMRLKRGRARQEEGQ